MKVPTPKKTKNGMYRIQMRLGGVNRYVYGITSTECKNKAALLKSRWLNGEQLERKTADITLKTACEQYIAKAEKAGRSPETIRGYHIIMNNRFQSVMSNPVNIVQNWQELYDKEAKQYSPKTMKNTWSFIRAAVQSECGLQLPDITTIPTKRTEHTFLTPDEIKLFVKEAETDKYAIALYLALCSCRASEILALDWKDVDLKNNRIHIHSAMVRDKNNKKVDKPVTKTASSTRYIPIFIPALKSALNHASVKKGKVITANENTLLEHSNAVCDKAGLPRVGVHGLRHSFASLAYSLEIPIKVTMQIGGWSDMNTIMKVYTHLAQKDVGKQSEKLYSFFQDTP